MKSYSEFITEASWGRIAQLASKRGRAFLKPGLKSGLTKPPLDIKMVGMPGSGKSTMAKRLADRTGGFRTGYDDARLTIHGTRANQSNFQDVHNLTMDRLRNAPMNAPRIQDNTNVSRAFRQSTDKSLRDQAGFRDITQVSPDTSARRAFARNAKRNEPVPQTPMRIMASQQKQFRNTEEGKRAMELYRELVKRYRLNRKSVRARLGIEDPKKGK